MIFRTAVSSKGFRMSAIDKIADEDVRGPIDHDSHEDDYSDIQRNDDTPKKKSNYGILLIPAVFIAGVLGFAYFKMSKPVTPEISNVPVAPLQEKKVEVPVAGPSSMPSDLTAVAPVASQAVTADVAASSPAVAPPASVVDAMQPRLIPNPQNQQAPQAQSSESKSINAQQAPVANAIPSQSQVVNGSLVVPPTMIPARVSQDQIQNSVQTPQPQVPTQTFYFDRDMSNDQLRSEIDRRRMEIISLAKEAKIRGLVVPPPVCSGAPVKQVTLSASSEQGKSAKVVNKPAVQVGESVGTTALPVTNKAKVNGTSRNDYFVYAIVDGRAWITSAAEKNNVTVAVGEQLPDGSIVQSVNAKDSKLEVKTSKGIILADSNRVPGR